MKVDFRGAGGSSGGGSKFTTSPDNLRSNDTFEGLIGLCVGPIKGPVNGMKSVRVNQTPIEDTTGKDNFENFAANFADGDPLKFPQRVTLRLGAAGAPDNINTQLRNIGGTNPVWSTHTLNQTAASHIDLRFVVNQLYRQDKNGIYDETANILIEMKPVGTLTWINPFDANGNTTPAYNADGYDYQSYADSGTIRLYTTTSGYNTANTHPSTLTISGKTSSTYVKELRVNVPNTGVYANVGWDIRCQLQENEDLENDPNFEKRNISWESATAVYANTMGSDEEWRALAWLQLYGKASDSFSGVPDIDGVYDTKIVSVPPLSVYDPDTRLYTGAIWDGSWAKAFTNDPAWILNDAITDSISGLARLVPGAYLNKWDALELSKYASELVSDGAGGQEPRFSLNLAIDQPQRSDDFIRYLAGACGATAWDNGNGEWRTAIDRPKNPAALYTFENIEGEFNYSHTDIDTRYNEVSVTFINEEFDYRQDQVKVSDPDHIAKFGRKPTSVVAIGCTNRRQALRWAILKLRTNINEFRNVSYTTNRQGKMLERFGWVLIADQSLNMTLDDIKRTTGRVVQNKGTSVVLRDTVRVETGLAYQLHFTAPNPSYNPDTTTAPTDPDWQAPTLTYTRNLTNTAAQCGDVKELFIDSPLPGNVAANVNVALDCPGLPSVPKVYRVLDLDYSDDGERVTVNAIEVDTGKYTASDTADYTYVEPGYAAAGTDIPMPLAPSTGVLNLVTIPGAPRLLTVNWLRPVHGYIKCYRLERRFNGGPWITIGTTTDLSYELADPVSGEHEFRIYTIDNQGRQSLPLDADLVVDALPDLLSIIGNDDVISVSEKIRLRETVAQLETLSALTTSRADQVGITHTTLDGIVTLWDALLAYYSPAWNDLTADTTIYRPLVSTLQTSWSLNGNATRVQNGVYTTYTDNDAANVSTVISPIVPFGAGQSIVWGLTVKKDTTSTHWGHCRVTFENGATYAEFLFKGDGSVQNSLNCDAVEALDVGNEWFFRATMNSTPVGTTGVDLDIAPAVTTDPSLGVQVSATGSIDLLGAVMAAGDWRDSGRFELVGRYNQYFWAIKELENSISQLDGATSYALDVLSSYSFPYTSTGAQNYTTSNVVAHLRDQAGTAIASGVTWKYVVTAGSVNGNAAGATEYDMTVDTDTAWIPVSSLENNTNRVEIRAYMGTTMWPQQVELDKAFAAAPAPSGTTGSGSLSVSGGIGGTFAGSTPVSAGSLSGTTPSGTTSVTLSVDVDVYINSTTTGSVTATVQFQRLIGSTWTNIGASQSGGASYSKYDGASPGSISMSIPDTGLTAGTAYQWRLVVTTSGQSTGASLSGTMAVNG